MGGDFVFVQVVLQILDAQFHQLHAIGRTIDQHYTHFAIKHPVFAPQTFVAVFVLTLTTFDFPVE